MNKNKITALLGAGVLTLGIVGGTLAWFTSQDDITNVFNTGSITTDPTNPDAGITITENFPGATLNPDTGNMEYAKPVLPGDVITKEVSVTSTADYDQFLRAKITKVWKLGVVQEENTEVGAKALDKGTEVKSYKVVNGKVYYSNESTAGWTALDYNKIVLTLADAGATVGNTWTESKSDATAPAQGYYYYNDILKGSKTTDGPTTTSHLLKSVTFVVDETSGNNNVDNYYKNLTFDVKVEAEGIQASNGAAKSSGWATENIPAASIAGYTK